MYKDILRKSWAITWNHKYLWFFGLFATALSSAGAGAWNMLVTNISRVMEQPQLFDDLNTLYTSDTLSYILSNISNFFGHPTFFAFVGVLLPLALFALGAWLSLTSQGALISSASLIEENKKTTIERDFSAGRATFWRLAGLFALSQLAIYGTWFVLGFPLIAVAIVKSLPSMATVFGLMSFVIFVPLSVIVNFILVFASIYVVINNNSVRESVYQGWQLFRQHWLSSLEFSLLLFLINIIVVLFFVVLLAVPLVIIILLQSITSSYILWSAVITLVTLLFIGAVLTTFQFSATVLFVKDISKMKDPRGFIARIFNKIKNSRRRVA